MSSLNHRQARNFLSGRALQRANSDDELGLEDYDWDWVYVDSFGRSSNSIQGARHGSGFQCMLGDCVLLKAEGERQAWVGIICEFLADEEEGEKMANFMWFSTEKEIRNKEKKRVDYFTNELYITPAWDVNPLNSINGSAKVYSPAAFKQRYPDARIPKQDVEKTFICRRACNTRTATYSDEFIWEDVFGGAGDIDKLVDIVKSQTKTMRKRKARFNDDDWPQPNHSYENLKTPRKRQQNTQLPQKARLKTQVLTDPSTPSNKRIIVKKPLDFTPLGTRKLLSSNTTSPFQLARSKLHVSSIPSTLPCREESFATVYSHLEAAISEGSGSCIYISGTPGTGKTATVREVVSQLQASVRMDELDDFIFVEINGMKITDPHAAYSMLWEALRGERVSHFQAMELLEREFSHPSPRRVPCVVLMDELDQLVTKNQSVMYNFFNWPSLRHSRLIVLAVANTMDLPERTLSNKISSRLGLIRITFPGYTHEQLMTIIESRLQGVPQGLVDPDAIQFASRKVAAVSGDARRALDICRRGVEIAEIEASEETLSSKSPRRKNDSMRSSAPEPPKHGIVSINTIKQAISEATSSPLQQYLRSLPIATKLFLGGLAMKLRRTGIQNCIFGDIIDEVYRLDLSLKGSQITKHPQTPSSTLTRSNRYNSGQNDPHLPVASALGEAAAELVDSGIIIMDAKRGERSATVRLAVTEDELKLAFREDNDLKTLNLF